MERDFLGIGGRDAAGRAETGFLGRSALQWPFSNTTPAKQQFMNFQTTREEKSRNVMIDQLASPGFQHMPAVDLFGSAHRSPCAVSQHLGMDGQSIHQFQLPGYPTRAADHPNEVMKFSAVSSDSNSFSIGTSSHFSKASGSFTGSVTAATPSKQQFLFGGGPTATTPGGGSVLSSFVPREIIKLADATAQLTIFYAGMVNVYEDVPLEKAQAIMFLAGSASNINSNVGNVPIQTPVAATQKVAGIETKSMNPTQSTNQNQKLGNVALTCSTISSPMPTASHSGAQSGSSSNTSELTGAKANIFLAPTSEQKPPNSIVTASTGSTSITTVTPRAAPQARKASLARFLEKRKERVTNAAPYPSPQKTSDYISVRKSTTTEGAKSCGIEQSWCVGTQKNSADVSDSLSTKLEI